MLSRFKKETDEETGETLPSGLLQKAVQTRLRPLMSNVRRSSIPGNASTSGGLLSASGFATSLILQDATARNLTEIENNIEMVEIAFCNEDIPIKKQSARFSPSEAASEDVTTGDASHHCGILNSTGFCSGLVSASGLATSLITQGVTTRAEDNIEMEEIVAKNDEAINNGSKSTISQSATTSKELVVHGHVSNLPGAPNSRAIKHIVAGEYDGLEQRPYASLIDIGSVQAVEKMNFPRRSSSCSDIYNAAAITTGLRAGQFVAVIPATRRNATKIKSENTRGLTEWCINQQYYMGLAPFRFDEKGRIVSTRLSKVAFLSVNILAITYSLGQVRVLHDTMNHPNKKYQAVDKVYWYIWIGYQLGATLLQIRYFTFMWFDQKKIQSMVKADRRCKLTTMKSAKYIAAALRIYSTVVSFLCTVGGFGLIHALKDWSVEMLLGITEGNIYTGFLQDALNTNQSANSPTSSTMGNITIATTTTASILSTTIAGTIESPGTIGWFIEDGELETKIIGGIGLFMSFCYHSQISCASEIMTSSILSLWNGIRNLDLEKISGSQRENRSNVGNGDDSGTDEDVATEDEEYSDDLKDLVFETRDKFKSLWHYATKSNTALKTFWPALALVALLMTTFILFGIAEKQYFDTIGFVLLIIPIFVGFYLALKTAMTADDYQAWFSSDRAQAVLKSSVKDFQMTFVQLLLQPFGYGTGLFYVNSVFLAGFLGAAVTYFFTQTQSFHTATCKNN